MNRGTVIEQIRTRKDAFWKRVEDFKRKYPTGTPITEEIKAEDREIRQEYQSLMTDILFELLVRNL